MKIDSKTFVLFLLLITGAYVLPAFGADEAALVARIQTLEQQIGEMRQMMMAQNEVIQGLRNSHPEIQAPSDFQGNLKGSIGDADKWLKGLKYGGDFRLRYEAQGERHDSAVKDRNRFRYRLRFGFEKTFSDEFLVGYRLASSARTYDPTGTGSAETIGGFTSTDQSFDNNFDYKAISTDLAYATYLPKWIKFGPVEKVELTAGKFRNPLFEGSAPLMLWDSDVTPEGAYEKAEIRLLCRDKLSVNLAALAGQFVLEEGGAANHDDAELWVYQTGLKSKIYADKFQNPFETKNMVTFYDYSDFVLPGNWQAAGGNFTGTPPVPGAQLAAGDFNILETYHELLVPFERLPKTKLFCDYAVNVNEGAQDSRGHGQNNAWTTGIKLGSLQKKGSWEAGYQYLWIEANAVPGIFVDSTFGQADRRGSVVTMGYAFTDFLQLNVSTFFTNRISAESLTRDEERKLMQIDLLWKF